MKGLNDSRNSMTLSSIHHWNVFTVSHSDPKFLSAQLSSAAVKTYSLIIKRP